MVVTNKQKFNKKYKQPINTANGKDDIVRLTGIPKKILDEVYDRGIGAYKTNPKSVRPNVKSKEQWAMARVNSFLKALSSGKFRGGRHDTDVSSKCKKYKRS